MTEGPISGLAHQDGSSTTSTIAFDNRTKHERPNMVKLLRNEYGIV